MSKSKKEDAKVVKAVVSLPKSVRVIAARGRVRGLTRKSYTRPMVEAEANYQEWRRSGFKGAWWWQYFKGADAA